MSINKLLEQYNLDPIVIKLISFSLISILIFLSLSIVTKASNEKLNDSNIRYKIRKIFNLVAFVVFILAGLSIFQAKVTNLTVIFGLTGAGIAFALQELVLSFAGWFAIHLGQIYKTGDRISIAGICGDVIDIDFLRTTLMECGGWVKGDLYDGRIVKISNSNVFKEPIFNYNSDYPFLWDEIIIPIRYGSNIDKARALFLQIANEITGDYAEGAKTAWKKVVKKYMIENAAIEPMVSITADENFIKFTIRYITDYRKKRTTKDKLFSKVLSEIEQSEDIRLAATSFEIAHIPELKLSKQPQ